MSTSYNMCEPCGVSFDAAGPHLYCNACGSSIGPCCKTKYLHTLDDEDKVFEHGEMLEDRCPYCK